MRVCLLTQHPQLFTQQRFVSEVRAQGLELTVLKPTDICWSWPNRSENFVLTFNRLSATESGSFELSLSAQDSWGLQVNPWELRHKLWDKSRQVLWLTKQGLATPASFMLKGPVTREHPQWRAFAQEHSTGLGWVLKFNRGQRGVGVNFVADEGALFGWLETLYRMGDQDFLIQPRLPNEQEYRLTLLAGRPWALLRRTGEKGNFAQGGSAQELPFNEWPLPIKAIAEVLRDVGAGTYLSLDILLAGEGAFVLDVNTSPGVEQLEATTGQNFVGELVAGALKLL